MSVRARMTAGVARQLRRPGGVAGRLVGVLMNRRNRRAIAAHGGAITVNSIYFIADLERALAELTRTLKLTGRAVIGVADPDWMRGQPTTDHGFRVRSLPAITDAAANAGLILDDHRHVGQGPDPYRLLVLSTA